MSFLNKVHYNYRWGVRVYQRQSKRQMLKDLVTHRWLTKWYHPRPTICCCICLCLCLCLCTVSISVFICICLCHQTYQVMSSAPHSPPVFVKVVPSEKRKTPSSSLDDMNLKYFEMFLFFISQYWTTKIVETINNQFRIIFRVRQNVRNPDSHIINANPEVLDGLRVESWTEKFEDLSCVWSRQKTTWILCERILYGNDGLNKVWLKIAGTGVICL